MKKDINFLNNYFEELQKIINPDEKINKKIILLKKYCLEIKKNNKKIFIFGNGGSSSIASHFTTDMIVNNNIKVFNFSDANLLTCFANDYGYENWVKEALNSYADKNDLVICISSSGTSKNIINAALKAKKMECRVVTFSGFGKNNPLNKIGKINFWIDSSNYNIVEMTHHIWMLSAVDKIANSKF